MVGGEWYEGIPMERKSKKKSMAKFGIVCVSGSAFALLRAWTQMIWQDFPQFTPWLVYY